MAHKMGGSFLNLFRMVGGKGGGKKPANPDLPNNAPGGGDTMGTDTAAPDPAVEMMRRRRNRPGSTAASASLLGGGY